MRFIARTVVLVGLVSAAGCTIVGARVERTRVADALARVPSEALVGDPVHVDVAAFTMKTGAVIEAKDCTVQADARTLRIVEGEHKQVLARSEVVDVELRQRTQRTVRAAKTLWSAGDALAWVVGTVLVVFAATTAL